MYTSPPNVELYIYNTSAGLFRPHGQNDAGNTALIHGTSDFRYLLEIAASAGNPALYLQHICPTDIIHVERTSLSFVWCHDMGNGIITFSIRFPCEADLFSFANIYAKSVYEILNHEKLSTKFSKSDETYLMGPLMQDTAMHVSSEDEESGYGSSESEGSEEESETGFGSHGSSASEKAKNSILAVGYKYDRSFVCRGPSIGVFKHTDDDKLKFETTIKTVRTPVGNELFSPSKMMLHEGDSSLIMMNPKDSQHLYRMDLERGEVVEEWKIDDHTRLENVVPDSKYAQMTSNKTLIGLSNNSVFRIDPRLAGNKRVDSETKQYVVKNEFSCGATTTSGELAVASKKGDIRLFNKLDKRAKTLLPGFGDAVLGIDVTDDGKMFTEAHFSTGLANEKSIIASTGPYVITWSLKTIRQGRLYDYSIRKYSDDIVADNFKFGQDKNIIVTLPDQVTMISKSSLLSPRKLRSFSSVVDSPF
ncbi:unnamed protein product [Sphagnum compactum]